jgi:hypothetical protein
VIKGIAAACAVAALMACGGGGGGGGSSAPPPTLTGTVAVGAPLSSKQILVTHPCEPIPGFPCTSAGAGDATTDAGGNYTVVPVGRAPYIVSTFSGASATFPRLRSIALRGGTVNVTPFTELVVTQLAGSQYVDDWFAARLPTPTDQQIATATQQVKTYLLSRTVPVNASAPTDFISTPFTATPGNPYDDALTALKQSLGATETLRSVAEQMMSAGDAPANYASIFPLDFTATCTADGPALPSGTVAVHLSATGVSVGTYTYTFQAAGESIDLKTDDTGAVWNFSLIGAGDSLQLRRSSGATLGSLTLFHGGSTTQCIPSEAISLASKWPSVFAQVKRFASTLTPPSVSCNPAFQMVGLQDGVNTLSVDANGILHAAPGGYSVSLISGANFEVTADVTVVAGVFSTKMRFFSNTGFSSGIAFDAVQFNISAAGVITSAQFNRARGLVSEVKVCP